MKSSPHLKEAHPEVLARHWTEAGETEPAIAQWSRAAETARARNAFPEALESCQQALALLSTLPESSERDLRELDLRQSVAWMLTVTRGHAVPEIVETTERLAALAERSGSLKQLVNLMVSRAHVAYMSADFRTAKILAEQTLELALREGSPTSLGLAHYQLVTTCLQLGDLAVLEKHFAAWLAFCDDPGFKQKTIPGTTVASFGLASLSALMLGRAELARQREAQMMRAAEANGNNPGDVAWAGFFASGLRLSLKEPEQAERLAAHALEVSEQHQFPQTAAFARGHLGLARALMGRASEGIELIREGIAGLLALGTWAGGSITLLGWAQLVAGDINGALATAEEALQEASDYPTSREQVLALRGELRLIQGQMELAEADFRERLAIARRMDAKGLELGATMSLARLLDKTGRRDEARAMLAEIYNWFTEGFDTADLKDAKALLGELEAES